MSRRECRVDNIPGRWDGSDGGFRYRCGTIHLPQRSLAGAGILPEDVSVGAARDMANFGYAPA
jgi:hypothetical protein